MLFHATYEKLLDSIQKEGLRMDAPVRGEVPDRDPGIYFTNSPDVAYEFAETSSSYDEDELGDIVVLAVDENELLRLSEQDYENTGFFADSQCIFDSEKDVNSIVFHGNIPPELVSVYDEKSWDGRETDLYGILDSLGLAGDLRIDDMER